MWYICFLSFMMSLCQPSKILIVEQNLVKFVSDCWMLVSFQFYSYITISTCVEMAQNTIMVTQITLK